MTLCGPDSADRADVGLDRPGAVLGDGRISIRTATARDIDGLTDHFSKLSPASRHNRFMGKADNLARIAADCLADASRTGRFMLVAEFCGQGQDAIVGEAGYAFDRGSQSGEFAISVADRWQRRGLGSMLLGAVQLRAINLGHFDLFGESLRTNEAMKRFARKAGFEFSRSPDYRALRFDKSLVDSGLARPLAVAHGSGLA